MCFTFQTVLQGMVLRGPLRRLPTLSYWAPQCSSLPFLCDLWHGWTVFVKAKINSCLFLLIFKLLNGCIILYVFTENPEHIKIRGTAHCYLNLNFEPNTYWTFSILVLKIQEYVPIYGLHFTVHFTEFSGDILLRVCRVAQARVHPVSGSLSGIFYHHLSSSPHTLNIFHSLFQ